MDLISSTKMSSPIHQLLPISISREEIRLVDVQPGDWDDPVTCTLSITSLHSKSTYKTLSYVWGDASVTLPITVNNASFQVTTNLHRALRRLRHPRGGEAMRIWVDAICIDQTHDRERSEQAAIMGKIYSSCSEVLVWLGDYDEDRPGHVRYLLANDQNNSLLAEYAADFHKAPQEIDYPFHLACFFYLLKFTGDSVYFESYPLPPFWTLETELLAACGVPDVDGAFKQKYSSLFADCVCQMRDSKWFSRVWVIQEFMLPPAITMCFGTGAAPADALETLRRIQEPDLSRARESSCLLIYAAVNSLVHMRLQMHLSSRRKAKTHLTRTHGTNATEKEARDCNHTFGQADRGSNFSGAQWSPFEVCVMFRALEASQDIDKVYAITPSMDVYQCKSRIYPDYTASVFDVYFEVCHDHIINWTDCPETIDRLAPLRYSRRKNKHKDLPSWVVDWTGFIPQPGSSVMSQYVTPGRLSDIGEEYWTSKGLTGVEPAINGTTLTVSGAEFDSISHLISLENSAAEVLSTLQAWSESRATQALTINAGTPCFRNNWRDFPWRTLCTEVLYYRNARFTELFNVCGEPLELAFQNLCASLPRRAQIPEIMIKAMVALHFGRTKLADVASELIKKMFGKISMVTTGNALFVTERGCIGVGDLESRPGDLIFILHQGDVPFFLRKTGKNTGTFDTERPLYRLIGECMVQGIMYGEAVSPDLETHLVDIE